MKTHVFFILIVVLLFNTDLARAQENDLTIEIDIISIASGYYRLPCDTLGTQYNPLAITFFYTITNNSDKPMFILGSDTEGYYRNCDIFTKDGTIGKFYLINNQDSIFLFSRGYHRSPVWDKPVQHSIEISALDYNHPTMIDFLCKFVRPDESVARKAIFDYLKTSRLVYVPIIEDYEKVLSKYYPDRRDDIAYPKHPIEIPFPNPFVILFGILDEGDSEAYYGE